MEWKMKRRFIFLDYSEFYIDVGNFQLLIPIGKDCRPAYNLKIRGLRKYAFLLDWQFGYTIHTLIHLFKTDFSVFLGGWKKTKEKQKQLTVDM